jgi:hypothetical protein
MKDYVIRTEQGYFSSHPQVEKIWAWGGCAMTDASNKIYHNVTVILKDGTRCDFGPNEIPVDTDIQVNNFLNSIPEQNA